MYIADYLARKGQKVILCEKSNDFMQRASFVNQARVHNGYHYPRSILTALRSRASYPHFCNEFSDCIEDEFEKYYLIGKLLGKVSANQFEKFCERIGAFYEPAPHKITNLVNPNLIEAVYSTVECAFNSTKIKHKLQRRIEESDVTYRLNTGVKSVRRTDKHLLVEVHPTAAPDETETISVNQVFNCTYSMMNSVLWDSKLELIPLKHEMAEMCLIEVPDEIKNMGLTVMCGPFFSTMPFPAENLHSFSHVRYTPHYEWKDGEDQHYVDAHKHMESISRRSAWISMIKDASRYLPLLRESLYKESIWEVKTVLPRSEEDDSRPILFKSNYGLQGFHCVLGGKIDNVYDAIDVIKREGLDERVN